MGALLTRINIDDRGNPAIINLAKNAKLAKKNIIPLGDVLKGVFASAIVLKGLAMLNRGMGQAISNAANFELAVKRLGSIGNLSATDLGKLSDQARELSKNTEFSATAIAEAQLGLKRMGLTAKEVYTALPQVVDLTTVAQIDMNKAVDGSIGVMRAFRLQAEDLGRITTVMATSVAESGMNFDDFLESMKYVSPIAAATNMSLEETAALLGTLANVGIKGSLAGTSLKNVLLNMLKPTDATAEALKGINFEGKTFADVLKILKDDLGPKAVAGFLEQLNKRAVAGGLAIADLAKETNNLQDKLVNSKRSIGDMADEMRESLILTLKQVGNNFNNVFISIGQALGSESQNIFDLVIEKLQDLDKWVKNNGDAIRLFATRVISLAEFLINNLVPIMTTLGTLFIANKVISFTFAISNLIKVLSTSALAAETFGASMMLVANPITIVIGLLGAYAVALNVAGKSWDDWGKRVKDGMFTEQANSIAISQLESLNTLYEEASNYLKDIGNMKGVFSDQIPDDLLSEIDGLEKALANVVNTNGDLDDKTIAVENALKRLRGEVKDTGSAVNTTASAFDALAEALKDLKDGGAGGGEKQDKRLPTLDQAIDQTNELLRNYRAMGDLRRRKAGASGFTFPTLEEETNTLAMGPLANQQGRDATENMKTIMEKQKTLMVTFDDYQTDLLIAGIERRNTLIDQSMQAFFEVSQMTLDTFSMYQDMQTAKLEESITKREAILERTHALELARAGESAFRRQMAEEKYQQAKVDLERQASAERRKQANKDKNIAITQSLINTALGTSRALADYVWPLSAVVGGIVGGLGLVQTGIIASQNLRLGGMVQGYENDTSDSVNARLSAGERVVSVEDLKRVGGNQRLQQIIDQGSVNTNNSKTIHIGTVIGTDEWVRRSLIPALESEYSR